MTKCFHCHHDNKELFRLLLLLVTYERLHDEEKEEDDQSDENKDNVIKNDENSFEDEDKTEQAKTENDKKEKEKEKNEIQLQNNINKHGSMLVQEMLKMEENQVILASMRNLGVDDMMGVAIDPCGCRVLEVLLESSTVADDHKKWCFKLLKVVVIEVLS